MGRPNPWLAGVAVVLGLLAGPGVGAGQELPPEIQVDLYMVRADRQIQNREFGAALESLDVVLALQARHGMETPPALWFRHAQVALDAGHPQTAIESATRYLGEAGRQGEHYSRRRWWCSTRLTGRPGYARRRRRRPQHPRPPFPCPCQWHHPRTAGAA